MYLVPLNTTLTGYNLKGYLIEKHTLAEFNTFATGAATTARTVHKPLHSDTPTVPKNVHTAAPGKTARGLLRANLV